MNCTTAEQLLNSYIDGEIDTRAAASVERHLQRCGNCKRTYDEYAAIKSDIKTHASYHPARASLSKRILSQVSQSTQRPRHDARERLRMPRWTRWLELGSAVAVGVALSSTIVLTQNGTSLDDRLVEQIVSGHSRAIVTSHLTDVASSDRHTVKPWLSSKLDFSPIVPDLATSGFPLRGGRLDYVNDRPVAVLVYARHQHTIDLFIWPDDASDATHSRDWSKRGLNIVHWSKAGMTYWAVSDLNAAELNAFVAQYAAAK